MANTNSKQFSFPPLTTSAFNFAAFHPGPTGFTPNSAFPFASHFINSAAATAVAASTVNPHVNHTNYSHHHLGIHSTHFNHHHHHPQVFRDSGNSIDSSGSGGSLSAICDLNLPVNYMRYNNTSPNNHFASRTSVSPSHLENSSDHQNFKNNKDNISHYNNVYANNNNISRCNNNDAISTLNGSPSQLDPIKLRLQSESPDITSNHINNNSRYENNNSPVDSSRSFTVSQKSSEEACGGQVSPVDSLGSRSPENLSNKKYEYSSTVSSSSTTALTNTGKILPEMLDHKLPLSFLGPPLAALHSMAEMKSPNGSPLINGNSSSGSMSGISSASMGPGQTTAHNLQGTANPHGIDTILSRPPPVTSTGLNALTGGMYKCKELYEDD